MAAPVTQKTDLTKDAIESRKQLEAERAANLKAAQEADRPATVPLAPGETAGPQTRGGPKLQGSSAERGELIGMRSGVPIYASAESLYGAPKPSISNTIANTPATADSTKPVMIERQNIEQQRAAYQAREAPKAAAAMAPSKATMTYWSPENAKAYDQAAAKEAALARVGGAEEVARRATEKAAYSKFEGDFTKSIGRENARQQIAAGTASPELIAKYPELNPLRSTAKPGDDDYNKMLTESGLDFVNANILKPRTPQNKLKPAYKFASVRH